MKLSGWTIDWPKATMVLPPEIFLKFETQFGAIWYILARN